MTPLPPIDKLIGAYRNIRDKIKEQEDEFKLEMAPLKANLEKIEAVIQKVLDAQGVDSMATASGTAFKKTSTSVKVDDKAAFTDFVYGRLKTEGIDAMAYMTCSAAKLNIEEFMEENEDIPPPGIKFDSFVTIQIRKPTKAKKAKK